MAKEPVGSAGSEATTVEKLPEEAEPERRIGAYRLLRKLGHGGMGTVYLAARADDQYQKRVAIKVIRGLDSAEIVRHFRRERQILAGLEHPHIARLLDGGTTDDGLPYFAMEHIDGQPIDRFCDERKLSVRERLVLFQGVCGAVQHAHRNLVVHRDIKPGNILVTAEGVPKLMDFGIAKLLNPEVAGESRTATGLAMTPEYASPEQARGGAVTTATDVYSLGVVLYELLTGRRPYRLKSRETLVVLKAICEDEPERPSTAVGRTEERTLPDGTTETTTADSVSRTREGTPERLKRRLRGDLDNIVLMALRKEPQRRYGSVEALSEDVRRYLEGRPVTARKATTWYRASKFVRRNAVGVAAAALLFALAVSFAVAMAVQSRRIARERDKAERLSSFMVDLFKVSDPSEARGNTITAREVLDKGAERISRELKDDPETKATLMASMGNVYVSLGLYGPATPLLEEALRIRRQILGREHAEVARSMSDLAGLLRRKGEHDRAESLSREALAIQRKLLGDEHLDVANSLGRLGAIRLSRGDYAGADPLLREALAIQRKLLGDEHRDVARTLNDLGIVLHFRGDFGEAEPLYREALDIKRRLLGSEHPDVTATMNNLAALLHDEGDYAAAEPLYREALATNRKIFGNEHPIVATSQNNLAELLRDEGDYAGAERLFLQDLALRRKLFGNEHPRVGATLARVAGVLAETGRAAEAEPLAREAVTTLRSKLPAEHPDRAEAESILGYCLVELRRYQEAEPLLVGSYSVLQSKEPGRRRTRRAFQSLLTLYEAWGRPEKVAGLRAEAARPR